MRIFQYLVVTAIIELIAALVLGLAASFIPTQWTVVRTVANVSVLLVPVGLAFRHLTGPLVTHFGTVSGDAHGSARFAKDRETAPLTRTGVSLLIGRDRSTNDLLRYDDRKVAPSRCIFRTQRSLDLEHHASAWMISRPTHRSCSRLHRTCGEADPQSQLMCAGNSA